MTDPVPSKERMPHWTCKTHGDFDARVAVGCPDCVRQMRDELQNLRRENVRWENAHKILLSEIDRLKRPAHEREPPHCSTCACGLTPEPRDVSAEFTRLRERESKVSGIYERAIVLRMDLEDLLQRATQPPGAGQ